MMGGDSVRLKMGEAFFDCSEEYATEYCEKRQEKLTAQLDDLTKEEAAILARQTELKAALYGRFGKAINLEE
jgi:prefoldin subunit 4